MQPPAQQHKENMQCYEDCWVFVRWFCILIIFVVCIPRRSHLSVSLEYRMANSVCSLTGFAGYTIFSMLAHGKDTFENPCLSFFSRISIHRTTKDSVPLPSWQADNRDCRWLSCAIFSAILQSVISVVFHWENRGFQDCSLHGIVYGMRRRFGCAIFATVLQSVMLSLWLSCFPRSTALMPILKL